MGNRERKKQTCPRFSLWSTLLKGAVCLIENGLYGDFSFLRTLVLCNPACNIAWDRYGIDKEGSVLEHEEKRGVVRLWKKSCDASCEALHLCSITREWQTRRWPPKKTFKLTWGHYYGRQNELVCHIKLSKWNCLLPKSDDLLGLFRNENKGLWFFPH